MKEHSGQKPRGIYRRIAAIVLAAAVLYAMFPMNVLAAADAGSGTRTVRTTDKASSAGDSTEDYCITFFETYGKKATVKYSAAEKCMLIIGLYTEDGVKMLSSWKQTVSPGNHTLSVSFAIDEMPSFYLIKAFFVNKENYRPLCDAFVCDNYTKVNSVVLSGKCGENITYKIYRDGLFEMEGSGAMYEYTSGVPWLRADDGNYQYKIKKVTISGNITTICDSAFFSCRHLSSIDIPDTVTSIGCDAFAFCRSLSTIHLPKSLKLIDKSAFYECGGIVNLTIPENVTSIGISAFENCSRLSSINIPKSVTAIRSNTFAGCYALNNLTIPNSVRTIGNQAFYNSGLTSITIPDSVNSIGDSAFAKTKISSIILPNTITAISHGTFSDCINLTDVTIPETVTSIGASAFLNCKSLTGITIPGSVTEIETNAFDCSGLTSITIPASVASMGDNVFNACYSLTSVNVLPGNQHYASQDGVLYNAAKNRLLLFPCGRSGSFTIPDFVTSIGDQAFCNCKKLTDVRIPYAVTSIGKKAFYSCKGLTKISIPDSVTKIGAHAFASSSALTGVTISNAVTSIDTGVFMGCTGLASVRIPDSVTSISMYAFDSCSSLRSIIFPRSLKTIGGYAFFSCYKITDVYYKGSQEDWKSISIGSKNDYLTQATITYHFTEPSPSPSPLPAPDASALHTVSYDNLAPNKDYLIVVSKSREMDEMIDENNLLYVEQKETDSSGKLTCSYQPREQYADGETMVFGGDNHLVTSIAVKTKPVKLAYRFGETLDTSGMVLKVSYSDGTTRSVTEGFTCTPSSLSEPGSQKITVSYEDKKTSFTVTVYNKLTIVTHPSDVTVKAGENASFSVVAKGEGLHYQWYYKKADQTSWSKWNGHSTATTSAASNVSWNGMKVFCRVTDQFGDLIDTHAGTVTVKQDLKITAQPADKTVRLGDSLTISIKAEGIGLTYQWYYKKTTQTSFNLWNGRTHATETVTPNATWDGIQLYCVVKDRANHSVKSNTITVRVNSSDITVTQQPKSQRIVVGETLTLSVKATGTGLKYQWYFKKKGQTSFSVWNGRTRATETVTPNATWDGIQLYCEIKDSANHSVKSDTITVTVNTGGITVTQQPKSQSIVLGKSLTLSVKATGTGLKYQWYFKKKGQTAFSVWNGRTLAAETVTPNATWDGIQLYCKITDSSGKTLHSSTVTVSVLSIATQPNNVSVAAGSNATFTVKATGSGLKYQWQYKKSGATSWSNWGARTTASTTATANATWQGMQVRCIVTDSAGNKLISNAATVSIK